MCDRGSDIKKKPTTSEEPTEKFYLIFLSNLICTAVATTKTKTAMLLEIFYKR